jgi:hypothetical protein
VARKGARATLARQALRDHAVTREPREPLVHLGLQDHLVNPARPALKGQPGRKDRQGRAIRW